MNAQAIRTVLSCRPNKLEKKAAQHGLDAQEARALQALWTRRLAGSPHYRDDEATLKLLTLLDGKMSLFHLQCKACGTIFPQRVSEALREFKRLGKVRRKSFCSSCWETKKKELKPMHAKKQGAAPAKKPVKNDAAKKKKKSGTQKDPNKLYHRPFTNLPSLPVKN